MPDPFANAADSIIAPASQAFTITPNDTEFLATSAKAIYVGTGGSIVVRPVNSGADVTFRNVVTGTVLAVRVSAVRATGTTAADIVGLA